MSDWQRPTWDKYFLSIAKSVSARADCSRRKVGAVLVKDHRIIATGYNGVRPGSMGCLDGGCPRGKLSYDEQPAFKDYSNCIATHAEMSALLFSPFPVQGATLYVTCEPCPDCHKFIKNAGLAAVYWPGGYREWTDTSSF